MEKAPRGYVATTGALSCEPSERSLDRFESNEPHQKFHQSQAWTRGL